jgi:hypothetical protein
MVKWAGWSGQGKGNQNKSTCSYLLEKHFQRLLTQAADDY